MGLQIQEGFGSWGGCGRGWGAGDRWRDSGGMEDTERWDVGGVGQGTRVGWGWEQ